jgi:GT2 family glycosyltransferase
MTIHYPTPYSHEKDLGKAYNKAFSGSGVHEGDWVCIRDMDTMFLTHDTPAVIEQYVLSNQHAGIITCFTNRISLASKEQLWGATLNTNPDISFHLRLAKQLVQGPKSVTEIQGHISGFFMLISKRVWSKHRFMEGAGKMLGVDTDYCRRIREAGLPILRMNSIYVWHTYRFLTNINDKQHLL